MAGEVEAVGEERHASFSPGDEVFGGAHRRLCRVRRGRRGRSSTKPANMTFEQAAAVPMAASRRCRGSATRAGCSAAAVLINGASGGVGTFAVQIAKAFGADVTAVCSTRNVEMVRSLGADQVIDYTQ